MESSGSINGFYSPTQQQFLKSEMPLTPQKVKTIGESTITEIRAPVKRSLRGEFNFSDSDSDTRSEPQDRKKSRIIADQNLKFSSLSESSSSETASSERSSSETEDEAINFETYTISLNKIKSVGNAYNWTDLYSSIEEAEEDFSVQSAAIGSKKDNRDRNRYKYVIPFDYNRVKLPECVSNENPDRYFNGSHIEFYDERFIACQAPTSVTYFDFWQVVCQYNVELIVNLVMPIENSSNKCFYYWNPSNLPNQIEIDKNPNLKILSQSSERLCNAPEICPEQAISLYQFKEMSLENSQSNRQIKMLHFENWPDHGVPDIDLFLQLLKEVQKHRGDLKQPILIHCSAGRGRTGPSLPSILLFRIS